jgi:hypothetical protein
MSKFFMFTPYDEEGEASCDTMLAIDKIIAVDVDYADNLEDIDANSLVAFKMVDSVDFSCYMAAAEVKALTDILLRD